MRFSATRPGKAVPRRWLDEAKRQQWDELMDAARDWAIRENRRVRVAATINHRGYWSYVVVKCEPHPVTKSADA